MFLKRIKLRLFLLSSRDSNTSFNGINKINFMEEFYMEKVTLFRWIVGIILIIGGITGMAISIAANITTKKANYYWTEKNMAKRLKNRKFKKKVMRLFRKKG